MRISARADYAVRALAELAADAGSPQTCEAIAESQRIPYRFLKAVVRDLREAGLVRSQRGCEGGYWLARPAAEITLAEVVEAVDGDLLTVNGIPPADLAYPAAAERLAPVWQALHADVRRLLDDITLASLARDHPTPTFSSGMEAVHE